KLIVAITAGEMIGYIVADDGVVAIAADRILERYAERDRDIVQQATDIRISAGMQVDSLGETACEGGIQRIVATAIPDREHHFWSDAEVVVGPAGGRMETIDRVAGARRHVGAVLVLHRLDVVEHRRRGVDDEGAS